MSIISDKQKEANQRSAQYSTGSKTQEGKAAIRFNAFTYGLRTRATILERENAADHSRLWDELEADWQPQNRTERCYRETMATSQWLLMRMAESERRIYEEIAFDEKQFIMLGYVAKQRAQLERSFRTAIEDMKQSQKERQARHPQNAQIAQPAKPAPPPTPPPSYVMPEGRRRPRSPAQPLTTAISSTVWALIVPPGQAGGLSYCMAALANSPEGFSS